MEWVIALIFIFVVSYVDELKGVFYTLINRPDRKRLSRKEEKALRAKAEEQQHTINVAADIFREVEAADRAFPQLPEGTKQRVDEFLEAHRPQLQLPKKKKK